MKVCKIVHGNKYYLQSCVSAFDPSTIKWTGIEENAKEFYPSEAVSYFQQLSYQFPNELFEVI